MIGVVGPRRAERIATAIERAGATASIGDASAVLDSRPDLVIAVGPESLVDLVRAGPDVPVLPVDVDADWPSVETVAERADHLLEGEFDTRRWPTLSIRRGGGDVARAAFETMLVTSDPASISEYRVEASDLSEAIRADGLVIATPDGSRRYASAAGGSIVTGAADVASVVPVGAFRLDRPRWVVDLAEPMAVDVTREERAVTLLVDGRDAGRVETRVEVSPGEPLETVALGE